MATSTTGTLGQEQPKQATLYDLYDKAASLPPPEKSSLRSQDAKPEDSISRQQAAPDRSSNKQLDEEAIEKRIKEIGKRTSEIRGSYFKGSINLDNIKKSEALLQADPEYRRLLAEELEAWSQLTGIEAARSKAFLEGTLPPRQPKEKLYIDEESHIFTKDGGVVNIRPIPQKPKRMDAKTALFTIAAPEESDEPDAIKGIFHDATEKACVATDGRVMLVVPEVDAKKTWIEGKNGQEIAGKYPSWKSVIPDHPVKVPVRSLQTFIDNLAGVTRAAKFVNNPIYAQLEANGQAYLFDPERLLRAAKAMQGTGSRSIVFEFGENKEKSGGVVAKDGSNPNKFALIAPLQIDYHYQYTGLREGGVEVKKAVNVNTLIAPVALGGRAQVMAEKPQASTSHEATPSLAEKMADLTKKNTALLRKSSNSNLQVSKGRGL